MRPFEYVRAADAAAATAAMSAVPQAKYLAGGSNLLDLMKEDVERPTRLVDISRLPASAFVGEVVMAQEITPFLAAARAHGCAVQVGTDMLFEMIPAYLEFFGYGTATADELRAVAQITY